MKDHLHTLLISLLVAAVIAGAGYWFFTHYELKGYEEQIGAQGEAAHNNLYYSRLFLKRMGIATESKTQFTLPDTQTVLVLDSERYVLSQDKIQELWAWVEQGGHLVTRLRNRNTSKDKEEFEENTEKDTEDSTNNSQDKPAPTDKKSSQSHDLLQERLQIQGGRYQSMSTDDLPLKAQLPSSKQELVVDFDLFRAIKSTEHEWALKSPKGDYWLVHKRQGKGAVTVVSEFDFADNTSLGDEDNAEFFWSLLHLQHTPTQVWIIRDQDFPSLLTLLWNYGTLVLFSFGALLVLSAWAWMPRWGALIPLPPPTRRRIIEHLKASSRFQWFQQPQGRSTMIESLRRDTLQVAQKQLHSWFNWGEAERWQALGHPLQLDLTTIQTLFQAPELKEAELIQLAQLNQYWRHAQHARSN
ncbi:DUF4350 domain-containing protein [Thiofilum flexile]|uniref:DUF4350 domain-containing protein n=1 Tax=Thiofilum flexile TaxID=125627 RepID=UPI000372F176|nr:DUF4350 domain-containing protein [Thiofilum flexile]